jgi:hypothetical protein
MVSKKYEGLKYYIYNISRREGLALSEGGNERKGCMRP